MRTTVSDKVRIFAKQMQGQNGPYTSYSTTMSKKKQDGSWENGRMYVEFQNGTPIPENIGDKGVEIEVVNGWLTFRNYQATAGGQPMVDRNGKPVIRTAFGVHIKEWRYPQGAAAPQVQAASLPDSFAIAEDDVPW